MTKGVAPGAGASNGHVARWPPPAALAKPVSVSLSSISRFDTHPAFTVLDKLNRGVVLLDSNGIVRFVNTAAMQMIAEGDPIAVIDDRVTFANDAACAAWTDYLQRSTPSDLTCDRQTSIVLRVPAGEGMPAFRVLISPLSTMQADAEDDAQWHVMMIFTPHAGRTMPRRILRELYGLSPAEADLADLLFQGASLEVAAARLHISVNTVRTQLQHVFVKCDVHSQAELLQLLALGPRTI